MDKRLVEPFAVVAQTLKSLPSPGLLLASLDANGRPNAMTIGWGSVGVFWSRPMFVVPVRESRYTHGCIAATGDFTVHVLPADLAEVAAYCGSVSGRDHDKFAERGLAWTPGRHVRSPIIAQCLISYECRVVHHNELAPGVLDAAIKQSFYGSPDYHTFYFGEILAVHVDEDV
jgi:flavin reductase (DIM6/NTAB) family NADH-FMN oxidoreductase RutF